MSSGDHFAHFSAVSAHGPTTNKAILHWMQLRVDFFFCFLFFAECSEIWGGLFGPFWEGKKKGFLDGRGSATSDSDRRAAVLISEVLRFGSDNGAILGFFPSVPSKRTLFGFY